MMNFIASAFIGAAQVVQAYFDTPHPYCIAVWESRDEQVRLSCLQINSTEEIFFLHTEEIVEIAFLPAEAL